MVAGLVVAFTWGLVAGQALTQSASTPTPSPAGTSTSTTEMTLTISGPIVDADTAEPVTADVYVDDELVQRGVSRVSRVGLAVALRVDRLTDVRVEAPGYEPWRLGVRGRVGDNKKMEGPIRLVPVKPSGPRA